MVVKGRCVQATGMVKVKTWVWVWVVVNMPGVGSLGDGKCRGRLLLVPPLVPSRVVG